MDQPLRVDGLAELRRALRSMERTAPRELNKALKAAAADEVLPTANALTPVRTGRLRARNRVSVRGNRVALINSLPYAQVLHWGGTTGPGHKPGVGGSGAVKVTASKWMARAAEQERDDVGRVVIRAIDRWLAQHAR